MSLSPPVFGANALETPLSERRRHGRTALPAETAIPLRLNRKEAGFVLNVSESGVGFTSTGQLRSGSTASLWFDLPGCKERVEASGVIAWTTPSGRAGIRFLYVPKSSQELLDTWLAQTADDKAGRGDSNTLDDPEVKAAELAIASRHLDFEDALSLIAERARSLTRADGAAVALAGANGFVCRATVGNAPDLGLALNPDSGLSGECIRSGKVVRCDDTEEDERVDKIACRALDLRSTIIVPIPPDDQQVSGILEVLSSARRNFAGRDVLLLRQFASLIHRLAATPGEQLPIAEDAAEPLTVVAYPRAAAIGPPAASDETPPVASPTPIVCDVCGHENQSDASNCEKCDVPLPTVLREAPSSVTAEPTVIKVQVPAPAAFEEVARATALRELQRVKAVPRGTVLFFAAALLLLSAAAYGGWRYWRQKDTNLTVATGAPAANPEVESAPVIATAPAPTPAQPPRKSVKSTTPVKTAVASAKGAKKASKSEQPTPEAAAPEAAAAPSQPPEEVVAAPSVSVPDPTALATLTTTVPPQPGRVSQGAEPAVLIKKTPPNYPAAAKQRRLQGAVVLQAMIKPDGHIGGVQVESGDPSLAAAAIRAVRQWVYKPAHLDGQAVEVQTRIVVKFALP